METPDTILRCRYHAVDSVVPVMSLDRRGMKNVPELKKDETGLFVKVNGKRVTSELFFDNEVKRIYHDMMEQAMKKSRPAQLV